MNQVFAVKFGGTSLADAAQFERVTNIIRADGRRRYIIASAPGKRFDGDEKVTDILIQCFNKRDDAAAFDALFAKAAERFISIRDGLKLKTDIEAQLDIIRKNISKGAGYDYLASRGEYLNGLCWLIC